jgi:hypothetical protein
MILWIQNKRVGRFERKRANMEESGDLSAALPPELVAALVAKAAPALGFAEGHYAHDGRKVRRYSQRRIKEKKIRKKEREKRGVTALKLMWRAALALFPTLAYPPSVSFSFSFFLAYNRSSSPPPPWPSPVTSSR